MFLPSQRGHNLVVLLLPVTVLLSLPLFAQPQREAGDTESLQKAVQNPVASLISVPLQNNSNSGIGANDRTQNALNLQAVVPVGISENWNLIIRWITPVIWQPALQIAFLFPKKA